jgi:hypothetical protein
MFYASDFNPRARAAIDWTRDQLSRRDCPREENTKFWNYLDGMRKEHREAAMLFVHGTTAKAGVLLDNTSNLTDTSWSNNVAFLSGSPAYNAIRGYRADSRFVGFRRQCRLCHKLFA